MMGLSRKRTDKLTPSAVLWVRTDPAKRAMFWQVRETLPLDGISTLLWLARVGAPESMFLVAKNDGLWDVANGGQQQQSPMFSSGASAEAGEDDRAA